MSKSLAEQSKDRVVTADELLTQHKSLVAEYFNYERENKPKILRDALRHAIEKIELKCAGIKN
jgi:hypothetical protein